MKFEPKLNLPHRNYTLRDSILKNRDGETIFEMKGIEVPECWSQTAVDILAQKYLRKAGVPNKTEHWSDNDTPNLPQWLMRSNPAQYNDLEFGSETSAKQVFHRLAGCWTYWGWKLGYFKYTPVARDHSESMNYLEEQSAKNFYDQIYLMLEWQLAAPNSPQWFNTGLSWAYGIKGSDNGQWFIDYEGDFQTPQPCTDSYLHPQPHACFIQPISDDLVGPGGIMDLWVREARLFKHGSGTGTNFSTLRGKDEPLAGGGTSSGLMSFLKVGDSAAGAIKSGGTTRRAAKMVVVDMDHPEIEDFINWKVREEAKVAALNTGSKVIARGKLWDHTAEIPEAVLERETVGFEPEILDLEWEGEAYQTVSGQNANNSIRVTDVFMKAVEQDNSWMLVNRTDGGGWPVAAKKLWNLACRAAWACGDPGIQYDDTINLWHTCKTDGRIRASNPCSEYHFLDNTACNLASLNLVKFFVHVSRREAKFDTELFAHCVRLWTVVLDISVSMASYPSQEIAEGSYNYRTLGLGYANLGGLLMRLGIPYDSDEGRNVAAAITALLHGHAYATSGEMAIELGEFPRFQTNKKDMLAVIHRHNEMVGVSGPGTPIWSEAQRCWSEVGKLVKFRNAQVTLLAPTGTIALLMDCDTTGIEPDYALVKHKTLAGGGMMKIVNQGVYGALFKLGYASDEATRITKHLEDGKSPAEAGILPGHIPVFHCAGDISPEGHLKMVAAVQPFLSGGVSKTINMPHDSTVEDVDRIYREGYLLGLKSVSIYRDGSKLSQPLMKMESKLEKMSPTVESELGRSERDPLPDRRTGYIHKMRVSGQSIYHHTGEYPDGRLGEIFTDLNREGSTLRSIMECFSKSVSIGIQYGVPLEEYVEAFVHTKFEPAGIVEGHDSIKMCSSIVDLIFRDLALRYLDRQDLSHQKPRPESNLVFDPDGKLSIGNPTQHTGQSCPECGNLMVRTGTCLTCTVCSFNEGCS